MLKALIQHLNEGVILLGPDGCVQWMNPRLRPILGIDADIQAQESLSQPIQDRMGFPAGTLQPLLEQVSAGQQRAEEQSLQIDGRYLRRKIILSPPDGVLLIFDDETEAHTLHQTQDELTSMIVHDLRSPLSAITSSIRLLRDLAEPQDSLGKVVLQTTEISGRAVRKLLNLVNSLLDVYKLESGVVTLERDTTDLPTLIQGILSELAPLADEMEVELQTIQEANLPVLEIDAEKIERVLYNLLDNAIKFTPGGGVVTVYLSQIQHAVMVRVKDSGPGIPDIYKSRLFNRFHQIEGAMARRRGTGLGLTYCKLTIEAHRGQIWIEDNPSGGAIFTFTLPI